MPIFTKDSLERLKTRVDLVDVLDSFLDLKKAGAAYKTLCPFHEEKTPSFMIQKGDTHYHCFGCGAHGDAISFLMNYQKYSFGDSVEYLAHKFQVPLEKVELEDVKGPSKKEMREALEIASRLYHTLLLHSEEGQQALKYLYHRGLTLEFIQNFEIGYSPKDPAILQPILKAKGVSLEIAQIAGLLTSFGDGYRDFFQERIMFPIRSGSGAVIGFSGRKFKESTYGGKYVNTPETPLFKKSRTLYGLHISRKRMAKDRVGLIVEGQIDALRLIFEGFDFTVAGQGTAFGEDHVQELVQLGVLTVFLAFDSDKAGMNATAKVGDLFHKEGVEAKIVTLPPGADPDSYIKQHGAEAFAKLLDEAEDYLSFLVRYHGLEFDVTTPGGKNELAKLLGKQIKGWKHELMVHESLKKLANLLKVPESMVGVGQIEITPIYLKKTGIAGHSEVDPNWVIETDLLRWLVRGTTQFPQFTTLVQKNLTHQAFIIPVCQKLYELYLSQVLSQSKIDLLDLICQLEEGEGQKLLEDITQKKITFEKGEAQFDEVLKKLLERNWMLKREEIRQKIQSGALSDDEALSLTKDFDTLKKTPPQIVR